MPDDKCPSLSAISLHKVVIAVYSKLGTLQTFEETVYVPAPRDTRSDDIERAARNYCYQNSLTVSSIKIHQVSDMAVFNMVEVERSVVERGRQPLQVTMA